MDNVKNGTGVYRFANGCSYEGYFQNDRRHGKGFYTWDNNSYYKGTWKNDKIEGEGVFISEDGESVKGVFEDGSGTKNYALNSDCKWLITAPAGKVIEIKFTEFDTEAKTDLVYFFNGAGTHEKIMAIFSGPNIPPELTTWKNQVLVWFVTDGKDQGSGWKAEFRFLEP